MWRTGRCRFSEVQVNEHPVVDGRVRHVAGELEHHDSPDLEHWLDKQNKYTTAEAVATFQGKKLADEPRLFGTALQRRMWIKKHFMKVPFRYVAMFLYHYLVLGAWRAGWVGYAWSRLRCDVYRLWEYKLREIRITGRLPLKRSAGPGSPIRVSGNIERSMTGVHHFRMQPDEPHAALRLGVDRDCRCRGRGRPS